MRGKDSSFFCELEIIELHEMRKQSYCGVQTEEVIEQHTTDNRGNWCFIDEICLGG